MARFGTVLVITAALSGASAFWLGSAATPAAAQASSCPTVAPDGTVSPAPTVGVDWSGCNLTDGGTVSANLAGADLDEVNLSGANLTNAVLVQASISDTDFSGANLNGANLANAQINQQNISLQQYLGDPTLCTDGSFESPCSITVNDEVCGNGIVEEPFPDEIAGTFGTGADFSDADLSGANLSNVALGGAMYDNSMPAPIQGPTCVYYFDWTFTDSDFAGARGVGIGGTPASLPTGWSLMNGCLAAPGDTCSAAGIRSAPSATFTAGVPDSFTVATSGYPSPSVIENGSLPAGVTFRDNGNGTATIAGTPQNGSTGTYALALTASNRFGLAAVQRFTLLVAVNGGCSGTLPSGTVDAMAASPNGSGYWIVNNQGDIVTCGGASEVSGSLNTDQPIAAMMSTADGHGYWVVTSNGSVETYGNALWYGDMGGHHLNRPIVGMAATPDGDGYWLVASDGGIFAFGNATFYGSTGAIHLNKPIVGMAVDPATGGYWLVASDGGIFAYNAPFLGSMGSVPLNKPVVGMGATANGSGYRLVAADGGIFSFGAPFYGSTGSIVLNKPIVGLAPDNATGGYWFVATDGGIFSFNAPFYGSAVAP
jgi:uncharacterized protein YjbI with pentapeptide repeats